jgi:hypothetical protein
MVRRDVNLLRVMIRCPMTGRTISTGLAADPATWDTRPIDLNLVPCPECEQVHTWSKSDASLEGLGGS